MAAHPEKAEKYRERAREYYHRTAKVDPIAKVRSNLRNRIRRAVRGLDRLKVQVLIGCTGAELRNHLEKQFKPGMTWANYGKHWVVDHKHPLSEFDLTQETHRLMSCHYSNLQPLTVEENSTKAAEVQTHQPDLAMPTTNPPRGD